MAWKPDYITLAEAKEFLRIADDIDDVQIAAYISAASRAIDNHCNRQFGSVAAPVERRYRAWYNAERRRWVVTIDDLQSSAGVVVTADSAAITDYTFEPRNAIADGMAWTHLVFGVDVVLTDDDVDIVAQWGWSVTGVPVPVENATYLQVSRFASRRDSPFGVAGSPTEGSELRLLTKVDPDVAVSLRGYRRPRRAG